MKRIASFLLSIAVISSLAACSKVTALSWQDQYDLGVRYLSEGNYEEAILSFTVAIEIDPKRVEAYVGRGDTYVRIATTAGMDETAVSDNCKNAETDYLNAIVLDELLADVYEKLAGVYLAMDDIDAAKAILQQGYEITGEELIKEKMDELHAASSSDISAIAEKNPERLFTSPLRAEEIVLGGVSILECTVDNVVASFPDGDYTVGGDSYLTYDFQYYNRDGRSMAMFMSDGAQTEFRALRIGMSIDDALSAIGLSSEGIQFVEEMGNEQYMFRMSDNQCYSADISNEEAYDLSVVIFYDDASTTFLMAFRDGSVAYMQAEGYVG